jgi:LysR family nitrogen assimilation transcriptional regulator
MINARKLQYFLCVVDRGALAKAAVELGVSQPTLSQQIMALEAHLGQKLLTRNAAGVAVTDAGRVFYRHARILVRQIEDAERDVAAIGGLGFGRASLGLATFSAASSLALPILRGMVEDHPGFRLQINDNFAGTLSDFIITGRIDLALAYTAAPPRGVSVKPLFVEELFAIHRHGLDLTPDSDGMVSLRSLGDIGLVLPSELHFLRGVVEGAFMRAGIRPRIVAEIDSPPALLDAVRDGVGATILPPAALPPATLAPGPDRLAAWRVGPEPVAATLSLCTSATLPMTSSIAAVEQLVSAIVAGGLADGRWPGVRPPA